MKSIAAQVIASTRLDKQGERNSKSVLEQYAQASNVRRQALHQQHDVTLPVIGYLENYRVIQDDDSTDDWLLIADVFIEGDSIPASFGGFSLSYMEKLRFSTSQERLEVFLPYPHYNDHPLIDEIFEEGLTSVGKIVRKGLSPETVALIVSVAVAALGPPWEDIYRGRIAPSISDFMRLRFGILNLRNIRCDVLQHVDYRGKPLRVIFVPTRGREVECFTVEKQYQAMLMVSDYLNALDMNHVPAAKMILVFDSSTECFTIFSVEFEDGSVRKGG